MRRTSLTLALPAIIILAMFACTLALRAQSHKPENGPASLQVQIVAKERQELDALKSGDPRTFSALIADDAIFVDPRGTAGKEEVVQNITDLKLAEYSMEGVKFLQLSPHSGVIAYKLKQKGSSHGKEFSATVYVSAVWTQRSGKWLCVFSQETPVREMAATISQILTP
jgi:ketosteroid isomerase-like protein